MLNHFIVLLLNEKFHFDRTIVERKIWSKAKGGEISFVFTFLPFSFYSYCFHMTGQILSWEILFFCCCGHYIMKIPIDTDLPFVCFCVNLCK